MSRARACLVVCALVCASPRLGATAELLTRVPITFTRNQVRVPVAIKGTAFQLILDTGMPTRGVMLYQNARVDSLELTFIDQHDISGAGGEGAVRARISMDTDVHVGDLTISPVSVIVVSAPSHLPVDADGIIGAELFERFAVRVDMDENRMDLLESASWTPPESSVAIPLRFRSGCAFMDAQVDVAGKAPVTVDIAVDLGASHALWLNEGEAGRLAPPANAIETTLGHGLSGAVRGHIGRVERLTVGPYVFENVVTVFPVPEHQHPGGFDFRDGFIGAETLKRFRVTFDYAGERMVLERGRRFADPFEHDMTGLVLHPGGRERRTVDRVLPDLPARKRAFSPATCSWPSTERRSRRSAPTGSSARSGIRGRSCSSGSSADPRPSRCASRCDGSCRHYRRGRSSFLLRMSLSRILSTRPSPVTAAARKNKIASPG